MSRVWVPLGLILFVAACGDGDISGSSGGSDATAPDVAAPGDAGGIGEPDLGTFTDPDGGAKPDSAGRTPLAGTGQPCAANQDCESGWCLNGPTESICTETCLENCPDSYVCKSIINLPPDVVYLCVPTRWDLCKPCASDGECGGSEDQCVPLGAEGLRCGVTCEGDGDCPTGYLCADGEAGRQCQPETGSCECFGGKSGQSEACSRSNEHGTCAGTRTCSGEAGWTECDAQEPAAETCNGADDDCDGATDEDVVVLPCSRSNEWGTCEGTDVCQGEAGWLCGAALPAEEQCNGADDDCDGSADEDFEDANGNGTPDCLENDTDGDGDPNDTDCAPLDPAVHHGATEECNGIDDNCNQLTDEGFPNTDGDGQADCVDGDDDDDGVPDEADNCPLTPNPAQVDTDQDGAGDACDLDDDGDGDPDITDCAPLDPGVFKGQLEACNGADDNCNQLTDEGFADTDADGQADCVDGDDDGDGVPDGDDNCPLTPNPGQEDADGDGLGDACEADTDGDGDPDASDCAPLDPAIHHGATEVCNGKDDDCSGVADDPGAEGCTTWHNDGDADGYGGTATKCLCTPQAPWTAFEGGDCDDANPFANPGAIEICGGGDEDCDGQKDEPDAAGCLPFYADEDEDGYGAGDAACLCQKAAPYTAVQPGDCDDADPTAKPTAKEVCNGKDDDCDGQADEPGAQGCAAKFLDEDKDGYGVTGSAQCVCGTDGAYTALQGGDCDDGAAAVHPGASEACNGIDDDCDGAIDGAGSQGCTVYYKDADGDGAGVGADPACLCAPAGAYTATAAGDCNDADPLVLPGGTETCAPGDEDCDGAVDEAGAQGCTDWYPDGDGDGFGQDGAAVCLCAATLALPVSKAGDCDDAVAAINPLAKEACGGGDEDCDGAVDEAGALGCATWWQDGDGDGYGAVGQSQCLCAPAGDYTAPVGGDCDDGTGEVAPGIVELCAETADCCAATSCVYGVCVTPDGACVSTDDCKNDTTCDAGQCLPWGLGPLPQADEGCTKPTVVGQFHPALQCEWTGPSAGDPFPANMTVIATPTVVDFDFDDDPSTIHPSIVIPSGEAGCDQPNSYGAGVIRVLDGRTCEQLYSIGSPKVVAAAAVALGDLDGDGRPEMVALKEGGGLVAFKWAAGAWSVLWTSTTKTGAADTVPTSGVRYGGPTIADVDGDGVPEVLQGAILYSAAGKVLADNLGLKNPVNGPLAVVADVDADGKRELVAGDGVWQYGAGAWVKESWSTGSGSDGFVALADFGTWTVAGLAQPLPEVVVVSQGTVRIQTLSGQVVFGPYDLPFFPPAANKGSGGAPTVGDFDGDGSPEVALAGRGSYTVFDPGCVGSPAPFGCFGNGILWSVPSQDYSSSVTGSSVFDFEADGLAEAVYADECFVRVYSGLTGEILFSQARTSGTWYENPIVADVDGDFRSEIVIGSNTSCGISCPSVDPYFRGLRCQTASDCGPGATCKVGYCRCTGDAACGAGFACMAPLPNTPGTGNVCRASHPGKFDALRVFSDVGDNWATSRTIWNQHVYFVSNVNEDGTIPAAGSNTENWLVPGLNNFRQNVQGDLDPTAAPDLTADPMLLGNCTAGTLAVSVGVCNRGSAPVDAGVPVAFFDGAPEAGGAIACLLATGAVLYPGDCDTVTCALTLSPPDAPHAIHVLADFGGPTGQSKECREGNNRAVFEGVTCLNLP